MKCTIVVAICCLALTSCDARPSADQMLAKDDPPPVERTQHRPKSSVPPIGIRNAVLSKAGLTEILRLRNADDLEKDVLVARAARYDVTELRKRYPWLSPEMAEALKREVAHVSW